MKKKKQKQGGLLDVIEARQRAIKQVDDHANGVWKERARESLWRVASVKATFTADDLREDMNAQAENDDDFPETHDLRATGAIMQYGQRKKWIKGTDRLVPGRFVCSHGRRQQVWLSLIVKERE